MRRLLSLGLLLVAGLSHAELYGVKLVSWTAFPETEGTGITYYAGGVTGTGLIATELCSATAGNLPPGSPYGTPIPHDYQYGKAKVRAEVAFNVFWVDGPPPVLYINQWSSGDAFSNVSRSTPGGLGRADSSAPTVGTNVTTEYYRDSLSCNFQDHRSGWHKTSFIPQNVTWTLAGYLGTRPIYRSSAITISLAGVSANGSASATGGAAMSMAVGAGGYGYFPADHPWP